MATANAFEKLFSKIELAIDDHVVNTATDIITFITPIVSSLLIIYLALWGISHIRGTIQEPLQDGFGRVIRIIFVVSIALNVGLYCGTLSDPGIITSFLMGMPDQLSGVISGASPSSAMLDDLMTKGFVLGNTAWEGGGLGNIGLSLIAIIVWGATIVSVAYAGFLLLFAKLAMVVLLGLGPIFIVMILFQATQRFFDMWIGQVINYAILMILAVALIGLLFSIYETLLNALLASSAFIDEEIGVLDSITLVIVSAINLLILRQIPQIAMGLSGGIALATSGFVSSALRSNPATSWLMRSTKSASTYTTRKISAGASYAGSGAYNLARRRFGGNSITGR